MYISYNASAKNLVSRYWSLFYTWGEKGLSKDLKGITWFSEVREGEPIVANRVDKGWVGGGDCYRKLTANDKGALEY